MKLPHGQSFSSEFCDICHACCGSHRTVSVRTPESTRTLDPHAWALCKCLPIACCRAGQCCVSPTRAIYESFQIACCRAGPRCGFRQGMRDCVLSCMLQRDALLAGGCHMVVAVTSSNAEMACQRNLKRAVPLSPPPFCCLSCLAGTKQVVMLDGYEQPVSQVRGHICSRTGCVTTAPCCAWLAMDQAAPAEQLVDLPFGHQSAACCCCSLHCLAAVACQLLLLLQKDTLPMSSCHLHLQGPRCWHCQKRHNCSLQGSTQLMPAVLRGRGLAALTALLTSDDPVSAAVATTKTALSMLAPQVGSVALTGWPCVPLPVTVACEAVISPAYCSDCEAEICLCDLL